MDNNKPLRQSSNKERDIYNTYMKNQEDKASSQHEEENENLELEDKIEAAISEEDLDNEIRIELDEEPAHDEKTDEEIHTLEDSVNSYKKEAEQLKDQLARRIAEMENMRKRNEREKIELQKFANERLLSNLIEIPDNIKQALLAASNEKSDFDSLKKGIELIHSKTFQLFEEAGVKIMEVSKGDEFDVDKHEALMHTPNPDVPEGHIIQVVQDGYFYKDKILRHAKVITSSGEE